MADLAGTAVLFGVDALARRPGRRRRSFAAALLRRSRPAARVGAAAGPVSETVVVTATAVAEDETELGAATTVITREQIETQRAAHRSPRSCGRCRGSTSSQSGDTGALTSVLLRGANSNDTLLLVDGVRMNSPYLRRLRLLEPDDGERRAHRDRPRPFLRALRLGRDRRRHPDLHAAGRRGAFGPRERRRGNAGQREGEAFATAGSGVSGSAASFRDAQVDGDRAQLGLAEKNGSARIARLWGHAPHRRRSGSIVQGEAGTPGPVGARDRHMRGPLVGGAHRPAAYPGSARPTTPSTSCCAGRFQAGLRRSRYGFFADARGVAPDPGQRYVDLGRPRLTGFASYERGKVDERLNFGVDLDGQTTTIWGVGLEDTLGSGGLTATGGFRYDRHSAFGSAWSPRATRPGSRRTLFGKCARPAGTGFGRRRSGSSSFPSSATPT